MGAATLGLLAATAARAQATINDCEKIQAADAYNQCLAKFGPTSKVHSVEPAKPGDVKASSADAAAAAGPAKGSGRHASRRRGRSFRHFTFRKHISFSVRRRHK